MLSKKWAYVLSAFAAVGLLAVVLAADYGDRHGFSNLFSSPAAAAERSVTDKAERLHIRRHKDAAEKELRHLRRGVIQPEARIGNLRDHLEEGGLTPEDIGTTEEELEELRIRNHKVAAEEFLAELRSDRVQAQFVKAIQYHLRAANLSPEDIGTTDKELEEFRVRGHMFSAKTWLGVLRETGKTGKVNKHYISRMQAHLQEGGLTPQDIGTTEEELQRLLKQGSQ